MVLADFFKIFGHILCILQVSKKPSEVDEVQSGPETEDAQVVLATGAHHGEKTPEGKSRKSQP